MSRTVPDVTDLLGYIKRLETRISNLERTRQLGNSAIDAGSVVVKGGAVVARHPNGQDLFRSGSGSTTLPFDSSPTDGYVTRISRASGVKVFEAFSSEDGSEAKMFINDRNGNELLGDDWLVGKGLSRPFIPWRVYKVSEWLNPPDITTSATFTGVYLLEGNLQHPAIYVNVRVVSDVGTTGEIRLVDTFFGNVMWSDTIDGGFSGNKSGTGTVNGFRTYGDNASFEVQIRRTAGAGNIKTILAMAYGRSATSV